MWQLLAPASVEVLVDEKLQQVGREQGEYFVFHCLLERLFLSKVRVEVGLTGVRAPQLVDGIAAWPEVVVRDFRRKRPSVSALLSSNEVVASGRTRRLFLRMQHGSYVLNPALSLRVGDGEHERWAPVSEVINSSLRVLPASVFQTQFDRFLDSLKQEESRR